MIGFNHFTVVCLKNIIFCFCMKLLTNCYLGIWILVFFFFSSVSNERCWDFSLAWLPLIKESEFVKQQAELGIIFVSIETNLLRLGTTTCAYFCILFSVCAILSFELIKTEPIVKCLLMHLELQNYSVGRSKKTWELWLDQDHIFN